MKVLHLISGLKPAGAENLLFNIVKEGNKSGIENVVVSFTTGGELASKIRSTGVLVYELSNCFSFLKLLFSVRKIIFSESPDTIHCWMYHANFLSVLIRILGIKCKIVWSIHNLNIDKDILSSSTVFIAQFCSFFSFIIPKTVVYVSDDCKINHINHGYCSKNAIVIENGIDTNFFYFDSFSRNSIRSSLLLDSDSILIGCVARWDPYKGHNLLFKVFKKILNKYDNVKLALIGEGMDVSNLELQLLLEASSIKDFVLLLGKQDSLPQLYSAMDCHVLPSISEAFGLTTAEAMSCGILSIATDTGVASRLVVDNKYLCKTSDDISLYLALDIAIQSISRSEINSQDCRNNIVDNFSIENVFNQYHLIWFNEV